MDSSRFFGGISHLARPVDLRHASNRFALLAAGVGLVVGATATLALTELPILTALWRGVTYGVTAFLVWALGRDLAPHDPRAARYAVFGYAVTAWAGPPALAATLTALVAARVIARTTGRPPTRWDLAGVVVLAAVAAASAVGFVIALGVAYALYADTRLPDPAPATDQHVAAGATAVVAIVVTLASGSFWTEWRGPDLLEAALVLAALTSIVGLRVADVTSVGDLDRQPLSADRVQHARALTLGAALAAVLWAGAGGIGALAGVFTAVIGAAVAAPRRSGGGSQPTTR